MANETKVNASVAQRLAEADAAAAAATTDAAKPGDGVDTKAPEVEKAPAPVVPAAPKKGQLQAVYGGPMINPFTNVIYTSAPSKEIEIDGWDQSQIEAGKLAIVVPE